MEGIDCFKKHGRQDLQDKFDALVKGGKKEYEAAREIVLGEHKALFEKMESLTGVKKSSYKEPDFPSEKIKEINDDYNKRINDEKAANEKRNIENQQSQQQAEKKIESTEPVIEEGEGTGGGKTPGEQGTGEGGEPPIKTVEENVDADGNPLSGIKKALVSDKIIEGVDLEKISDKEMMALGRKIIDTGEVKPEALVQKIITEKTGVLTPKEVVALVTYKADVDNGLREAYKQANEKQAAGEDMGTLGVEIADLERQQNDFDVMAVITANQQSMAFRLRKMMLDRDYNVVTQIEKYKKNNNGYIPPEIEAKFRDLDKQLKEVKEKLAEAEKRAADKEGQDAVDNIKESVGREKKYTDEELEKKVQEGVQSEVNKIYEQLPAEKKSAADKAIAALERFQKKLRGKAYSDVAGFTAIVDAGITTIKNAIKLGVAIEKAVELGINKIKEKLKGAKWDKEDEFRKDMIEGFEAEGISAKKIKDKPTINEDGSISIPNEMLRKLVERGITDINDLTKEVHKEVVKDLPDITERQVRDYITEYGKKVNLTADEIQQQVNTAKRVGRLLSELEDLQNRKKKVTNPNLKGKLTEKERELKRKINSLSKEIFGKEEKSDEQKLFDAKERVKTRIEELTRKIKNKDFAKPVKKLKPTDTELTDLVAKKEKLQEEFDNEQYKLELKNRNGWQKAEDVALEATSGLIRGLVASLDVSATLVQGTFRLMVDLGKSTWELARLKKPSPNRSLIAVKDMFRSLVSQKYADNYLATVKSSEKYPLMKASKLAIDDKAGHISAKEGFFISNWINLIWNHALAPTFAMPITLFTKGNVRKAYDIAKAINPYLASQRAFDGYVNSIRVSAFKDFAKSLENDGYRFESDPKVFQKAADVINTTTGRGSLGAADASSRWLNIFLFAPRKVVSEVKMFTPYAFAYYAKMPKSVRNKALKDLGIFLATFTSANALMWASNKPDDDDKEGMEIWEDFWNPNSSNFLTHKIGDKRISIGGGAKSMIVFQSRLLTGKFTDQNGKTTELGDRFGKQINTRFDLITNFIAGKSSPVISVAIKKAQEKKGLEVDDAELIRDVTIPIWMQDLKEMYKHDPTTVNAILTAFSIFGANVRAVDPTKQSQGNTPKEPKEAKEPKERKAKSE